MSNGGTTSLSFDTLLYKADSGADFESAIQNVLLSSSLKIRVYIEEPQEANNGEKRKKNSAGVIADLEMLLALAESSNALTILLILAVMVVLSCIRNLSMSLFPSTEHSTIDVFVVSLLSLFLALGTLKQSRDVSSVAGLVSRSSALAPSPGSTEGHAL